MAVDLFRIFNDTVGALYAEEAAQRYAATRHQTGNALQEILPALVHGITQKALSDAGARGLMDFLHNARIDHSMAQRLSTLRDAGADDRLRENGSHILKYLFGDRLAAITDLVAQKSELGIGASSDLTKVTATILISAMARYVSEEALDAPALRTALDAQKDAVYARMSDGLRSLLGLQPAERGTREAQTALSAAETTQPSRLSKILPWIILLITALALLYFVDKGCANGYGEAGEAIQTDDSKAVLGRENRVVTLADGRRITTHGGSFTARFTDALENNPELLKSGFVLDEVQFEPDSITLLPASYAQLDRLVLILKAYRDVHIRLEGYTDRHGDPGQKLSLSNQRARQVMAYLTGKGIAADRLRAVGRGTSTPLVSHDTTESYAKNNHIEVYIEPG